MEPGQHDRPEMELLDTGRPPSAFGEWVGRALRRPGIRLAGAVVAAVVLVGIWTTLPREEQPSAADVEQPAATDTSPGLRPPPPRGRESPTGSWQVADDLAITSGPEGHVVTFSAVNAGATPQDPADLEVVGGFVDRGQLEYSGECDGVDLDARGGPRFDGLVEPGGKVFVRCEDTTRYGRRVAWIDPASVTVRRTPCESEGPSLPM